MKTKLITILSLFSLTCFAQTAEQDTIVYKGFFKDCFLMESFTLYPDNTFKWTSEFDLSWDEYGIYKIRNNKLILDYYIWSNYPSTMNLKDSISTIEQPEKTIILEMEKNKLFYIDENGKRSPTYLKAPCKRKWGWLIGNKYEYIIFRED